MPVAALPALKRFRLARYFAGRPADVEKHQSENDYFNFLQRLNGMSRASRAASRRLLTLIVST